MAEQLSGAELDVKFFEVCLPYRMARIGVSTDATVCEAWAMRWAREQGLRYTIDEYHDHVAVTLSHIECWHATARGTDYKQAFVRACVAAGEILKQAKGGA